MSHPFSLDLTALKTVEIDFEDNITSEEAAQVGGGILPGGCVVTKALYESGGYDWTPIKPRIQYPPCPIKPPIEPPIKPPVICPPIEVTTLALGEEGGSHYFPI